MGVGGATLAARGHAGRVDRRVRGGHPPGDSGRRHAVLSLWSRSGRRSLCADSVRSLLTGRQTVVRSRVPDQGAEWLVALGTAGQLTTAAGSARAENPVRARGTTGPGYRFGPPT